MPPRAPSPRKRLTFHPVKIAIVTLGSRCYGTQVRGSRSFAGHNAPDAQPKPDEGPNDAQPDPQKADIAATSLRTAAGSKPASLTSWLILAVAFSAVNGRAATTLAATLSALGTPAWLSAAAICA